MKQDHHLTPAEWSLMECLWERSPRTGKEAVDYMAMSVGWSRSTTLTMLRRMTEKGLIACEDQLGMNAYSPLLKKADATQAQTHEFLNRVYHGSISLLLSTFTQNQRLSKEEIEELYGILEGAKGHD